MKIDHNSMSGYIVAAGIVASLFALIYRACASDLETPFDRKRLFVYQHQQKVLGDKAGVHVGDFVRRPDGYNDRGSFPKCGEKLKVSHLYAFSHSDEEISKLLPKDVWVSVVYPDMPVQTDPFLSDNSFPLYTDWVAWDK